MPRRGGALECPNALGVANVEGKSQTAFLRLFGRASEQVALPAGTTVFEAGEPGDLMYVVAAGEVEIIAGGSVLDTVRRGGIVGEMALIDRQPRSATARTRTDCRLVPINERRVATPVHQHPNFAPPPLRIMAARPRRHDHPAR